MTYTLEDLRGAAYNAYRNNSHTPEKRAESVVKDYSEELDSDFKEIESASGTEVAEDYKRRYRGKLADYLRSMANTASAFIVGPAKFPVEKNRKRQEATEKKYNEFREWRERFLKAVKRNKQSVDKVDRVEHLTAEIIKETDLIKHCKEVNKVVRDGKLTDAQKVEKIKLISQALTDAEIFNLLKGDFAGRKGYPAYVLTNANQRLKRVQQALKVELAKRIVSDSNGGSETFDFPGGKLIFNYTENRVQIKHDEKPAQEVIQKLKLNAFKWSPTNKCWQRILTENAKHAARQILNINK